MNSIDYSTPPRWDTLIRGARVFDGSGTAPVDEDIAIQNRRIVQRGANLDPARADRLVDARGLWLLPGMLDIHTHLDLEVEVNPGLDEVVRHGTTTVIVGNCSLGTAFGPQAHNGENPIIDCFARVENIPKSVLQQCVDAMHWDNTADYLEHFGTLALGPNIAPLIPHSMLRTEVMGIDAAVSRKASDAEIRQMLALLEAALDQGYAGMSTDNLVFHYLANDPHKDKRIPTQYASHAELKALTNLLRARDRVWQTTPINESRLAAFSQLLWTSGRLYGKPLRVSALSVMDFCSMPNLWKVMLRLGGLLNSSLLQGHFHFQCLATNFRMWANGPVSPFFEELESTRLLNACEIEDRDGRQRILADPAFQRRFHRDVERMLPSSELKARFFGHTNSTFMFDPHGMIVDRGSVASWCGDSIASILSRLAVYQNSEGQAGAKDAEEAEAFARFPAHTHSLSQFLLHCFQTWDLDFRWWLDAANLDSRITRQILFNPNALPGFNDSGAHIGNLAFYDGNLMALQLAQEDGELRVAEAVHRLTREPAEFFGLATGRIEIGDQADIVLIDPDALARYDSNAQRQYIHKELFDQPMMVNRSDGVVAEVLIAGTSVWTAAGGIGDALGKVTLGQALRATA